MENELISVIVPVYNVEKYLERCLESIINQTYKNLEIILVDDGSTDSSCEICDKYRDLDSRIKVIHKPNGGVSSARNVGIEMARGAYIGFVDSDDWIALNMYEILYSMIKTYNTQIAAGELLRVADTSLDDNVKWTVEGTCRKYSQEEYAKKFFRIEGNETVFYIWNKLYESSVAKKMVFPEKISIAEDAEAFFYGLREIDYIVCTDSVVYNYFYRTDSISSTWFSPKHMGIIDAWKNILDENEAQQNTLWAEYSRLNYERAYFGVLCRLMLSGEGEKYKKEKKILLENVKKYKSDLLEADMPKSRKIILCLVTKNYRLAEIMMQILKKMKIISPDAG